MTPSNYDEAQERLEFLRERLRHAQFDRREANDNLSSAYSRLQISISVERDAYSALTSHLESMIEAAAAEKAVRG